MFATFSPKIRTYFHDGTLTDIVRKKSSKRKWRTIFEFWSSAFFIYANQFAALDSFPCATKSRNSPTQSFRNDICNQNFFYSSCCSDVFAIFSFLLYNGFINRDFLISFKVPYESNYFKITQTSEKFSWPRDNFI